MNDCCNERKKHRSEEEVRGLTNRLSRIEGQIRGIRKMVDDEGYCTDILTQVSAAQAALNAFARELLGSHIKGCVINEIRSGDDTAAEELIKTLQLLMR